MSKPVRWAIGLLTFALFSWVGILPAAENPPADPRNAIYTVERRPVPLRDGRHEAEAAPGSAAKAVTSVFGEPAFGDLDGDGDEDAVLLLVHDPGGSGTFYYIAASINENGRSRGTEAVFLGDRISPQRIGIRNGVVVVDYADRRPGEPMSTPPSIGTTKCLTFQAGRLAEIPCDMGSLLKQGKR
jgi:hypothetical protein